MIFPPAKLPRQYCEGASVAVGLLLFVGFQKTGTTFQEARRITSWTGVQLRGGGF